MVGVQKTRSNRVAIGDPRLALPGKPRSDTGPAVPVPEAGSVTSRFQNVGASGIPVASVKATGANTEPFI